jgi:hypothetical protein
MMKTASRTELLAAPLREIRRRIRVLGAFPDG